jgi:hypothetical protein
MLILDFRTGKMTKLAFDLGYIPAMAIPGALLGLGGAGLGSLIDMLAGTDRRWTKILGLLGLAGGAGAGGLGLHWYKQYGTPEGRLRLFRDMTSEPASERLISQRYPTNEAIQRAQKYYQSQKPVELFKMLVGNITSEGGPWFYSPEPDEYRVALFFLQNHQNRFVIDVARDVALRGKVLDLYREEIPLEQQQVIDKDFKDYVDTVMKQLESGQPKLEAAQPWIDKIEATLRSHGHGAAADLFKNPVKALQQPQKQQ